MREPYRTLLGHVRHVIGHYYRDQLVADMDWLEAVSKNEPRLVLFSLIWRRRHCRINKGCIR